MSIHFHPLRVKDIRKETADCVSVVFDVPQELQKTFQYQQGQSLTMRTVINNQEIRRTYSICSSPLDKEWKVAIKKVAGGLFSTFANEELKKGDVLEVMQPIGKFYTPLDAAQQKQYIAFAAGSGITPLLSIIKTTLAAEPNSQFTLVYGNKNRGSIIFFEELEALKNKYLQRFSIVYVLSRERMDAPINSGRITTEKLEDLKKLVNYKKADEYFICGPSEMIFSVIDFLERQQIEKKKIHFELFTTSGQQQKSQVKPIEEIIDGPQSHVTIKLDGRSVDFKLPLNSTISLLDAALAQGADLPFACKGGVCCTCKAKLLEGQVSMDVHWGLEDEEVEEGYILTCQSHPLTNKVVVDFDIK
jgi:ring-1,2-phenylacetyl-CoA epoxidase subunit PaaE